MSYIGPSIETGFRKRYVYTATAGQTSFSGNDSVGISLSYTDSEYLDVYQNGVLLVPGSDYTATTGTTVVLVTGASVDDKVEMIAYQAFGVADTVSRADGGAFGGNISTPIVTATTSVKTPLIEFTDGDDAITIADGGGVTLSSTLATTGNATFSGDIIKSTSGSNNFAAGVNAGNSIQSGGNDNVAVGDEAGTAITTGDKNVLVGYRAGDGITTGSSNIAIGRDALTAETAGSKGIAIGAGALETQNNSGTDDSFNVAIGTNAGLSVTTGDKNSLVGHLAGDALTTGNQNVAVGYNALSAGTTYDGNTAIGYEALKVAENTSGADGNNVGVGASSAIALTSGLRNTIIGVSAGASLTTGNDNICIGKGADVSANAAANQITIGNDIDAGGNNNFSFGKASNVVTNDFDSDANWSRSSDRRKKREIYDQELGLAFVNDLRTVNFKWKPSNEFPKEWNDYSEENNMDTDVIMHGFIAQEVKEALDKHSSERDSKFSGWKEGEDGMQHTSREMFVIPLIKAVQELSAQVNTLKEEIKELKNE